MAYHVPNNGKDFKPSKCSAKSPESCRYTHHYPTLEDAWEDYTDTYGDKGYGLVSENLEQYWDIPENENSELDPYHHDGPEISLSEMTVARHMLDLEDKIATHEKNVSLGHSPYSLGEYVAPEAGGLTYADPLAIAEAWINCDYDKVRRLNAIAIVREADSSNPGSVKMAPDDFIYYAKKEYTNNYMRDKR